MKKYLVPLLFLLLPLTGYAQIVIEDRIEVNPIVQLSNSPNNPTEPTYTYILSWPSDQYRRGKIQIISCYGDTTDTGWTTGGYATTSMPGRGHHIFKFINQRWYYNSIYGWGWYYDDNRNNDINRKVLINNQELNIGNLLGAEIGTIDIPLLYINDNICDSGYVKLEVAPTNWAECEEIGWLPIDQISLRIISGSEFASFYNIRTGTNLGSQAQINPFVELENLHLFFGFEWEKDGLDDVVIILDENIPADSVPVYIEVEAEINGVEFVGGNFFYPEKPLIITEINPAEITTGEETSISVEVFNLCEPVDPYTTINLEIIKGQEYGSLIDPYTNEKTKMITDLYLFWGYAWVDYIADGISTDSADTVIIRVSTTDPEIVPKEAILIIKPPPIYAYTVPEVLGADDTADVIIKHRLEDGTLEDFPPEQTFELAVLDGCVNGNFMVDDSINVYFADALQPIKFVTADSLDPEFDKVLIRVGTDIGGGGGGAGRPVKGGNEEEIIVTEQRSGIDTLRAGFEKMIAEKKAEVEAEKKENNEPPIEAPIIKACPPVGSNKEFNFNKNIVVGNDDCSKSEWACPVSIKRPKIDVKEINLGNCLEDEKKDIKILCKGDYGFFHPIYEGPFWEPQFTVEPCFNSEKGIWQLNYNSDSIYIRSYTVFCPECVPESGIIRSLDDVWNKIPEDKLCKALADFELQKNYRVDVEFIIEEQVMAHERLHKTDFFTALARTLYYYPENDEEKYNTTLLDSKYKCKDAPNYDVAVEKLQNYLDNVYQEFQKDLKNVFTLITGVDGTIDDEIYENKTHGKPEVQKLIQDYIDEINNRIISINKSRTEELKIKCN